ncbi:hypothetical protein [uncultured Roseovarius sp.]|uniref:hypothetical protein n=1 Tax=uncultured Roseovarius sp. TaxID=293344 RepID=UPI0025FF1958|nr:hypothetical protein [uncultured Roseovarius sp.]
MLRRSLLIACLSLAPLAGVAQAQTAQDRIVQQLRDQGFDEIEVTRTWLGRVRIVAEEDDTLREIILNPNTGHILRDYWVELDDDDDDDDRDDDDDDRDDDDDYHDDDDDDRDRRRGVLDNDHDADDD